MSYSFEVRAKDKQEARDKVRAAFEGVVRAKASHANDMDTAGAATFAFIDVLADDPSQDVIVKVDGSLSGPYKGEDFEAITGASFNIRAFLVNRT